MGQVAVGRLLLIGATVALIVLLINVSVSLATDSTSVLRWLAVPVLGVVASVASAVSQARNPVVETVSAQERLLPPVVHRFSPHAAARRLGQLLGKTSLVWGLVLAVVVIGCAGTAAAIAGQLGMGWVTGNEHGPDRLVRATSATDAGLTVTVQRIEHTPHYTRVTLHVDNETSGPVSLSVAESNCLLIGGDGTTRAASAFRSDWTETLDEGKSETGIVTFEGHLAGDVVRAKLSFVHVYAATDVAIKTFTLAGIPLRPAG